jgi:hypothetical protein
MEKSILEQVCQAVYSQFPAVKGQRPKVSKQSADKYLLLFSSSGNTPDGMVIQQQLRVVATGQGQIIKTSMSR